MKTKKTPKLKKTLKSHKTSPKKTSIKNNPKRELNLQDIEGLFENFAGKRDDLILNTIHYLCSCRVLDEQLWKRIEKQAIKKGVLKKGGYMEDYKDILEAGRLENKAATVLKMIERNMDSHLIAEITGLPEQAVKHVMKKLKS